MQSMPPTSAGRSANNAASSQDDDITVIASSVAPTDTNKQKTKNDAGNNASFSSHLRAKESPEGTASDSQEASPESIAASSAGHPLIQNLGQAPFTSLRGEPVPSPLTDGSGTQTVGNNSGSIPCPAVEAVNKVSGTTNLSQLAAASLTQRHQMETRSGQAMTGTVSSVPASPQTQSSSDASLTTLFTSKLNEVLASKSEQSGLSALNNPVGDVSHSAVSQPQPASQTSPARAVWANVQVDTSQGKWGEQMLQVLQDRVSLQATQNLQEARIRLDPPDLGKLDLTVRVDGDRLNVQINANNAAVRDALVQVSERLRAELQQQQFVHVDVNVGTGDQGQASYSQAQEDDSYQPIIFEANDNVDSTTNTASEHWLSTTA